MSRDEASREVTVHSALRLPSSSSLLSACVPSIRANQTIHERGLACTVTHMLLTCAAVQADRSCPAEDWLQDSEGGGDGVPVSLM